MAFGNGNATLTIAKQKIPPAKALPNGELITIVNADLVALGSREWLHSPLATSPATKSAFTIENFIYKTNPPL